MVACGQPGCRLGRALIPGFEPVCLCSPAADRGALPPGVSGVGTCPLIWMHTNQASGVCWGCLCGVNSPGAEGVGAQETTAAGKNSLNSCRVPLFSLFLFEKFLLFKPSRPPPPLPTIQTSTWPLTQPSLALSQESCSRPCGHWAWGFSHPGSYAGPGTLLSLSALLTI